MWRSWRAGLAWVAVGLVASACRSQDEPAAPDTPPAAEAAAPTVRMKPHEVTPAAALGTLPPGVGIAVGQPAPAFTVEDAHGANVTLTSLLSHGPTLLVFYRGGWCPFCNFQMHELVVNAAAFTQRGVQIAAISVDAPESAAATQQAHTAPFAVLSDPDLVAHKAFHVVNALPEEQVTRLKGMGINLEKSSARSHHSIAIPSLFLIDAAGTVRWAHADTNYKVRPSVQNILAAIDQVHLPEARQ